MYIYVLPYKAAILRREKKIGRKIGNEWILEIMEKNDNENVIKICLKTRKDERRNVLERQEHKVKYNNNNLYDLRKIFTYHLQQNSRSYSSFRSEFSSALHSLSHKSQFNFEFILIINKVRASEFVEIAFFIRKRKYKTENKRWTRNSCHSCIFYLKLPFRCFCTEEDRNDL